MRQLLLLCQSPDDVKALPAAYSVVKAHYDACWMLFSPACLVDTAAESAQHEENLRRLDEAVIRCSTSRDFEGAKNYQQQLEAARIDQVMKVKEAWKTLTEEQRTEATKRVFGAFVNPAPVGNFRHEMLVDHYEPAQFIDALNSKKKTWFAPCVPGTFTIDWVSNLAKRAAKNVSPTPAPPARATAPAAVTAAAPAPIAPAIPSAPVQSAVAPVLTPADGIDPALAPGKPRGNPMMTSPRYRTLASMNINQVGHLAIGYGLNPSGSAQKIAAMVWKHEHSLGKA
jgi:hypothetical protein